MSEINATLNLNEICRLCLMKNEQMTSIFTIPLPTRIMSFVSIEVFEGDGLPALICQNCAHEVDRSYRFKIQCENSYATLKQYLKRSPENSEDEGVSENMLVKEESADEEDSCDNTNSNEFEAKYVNSEAYQKTKQHNMEDSYDGQLSDVNDPKELKTLLSSDDQAEPNNSENILVLCNPDQYQREVAVLKKSFRKEDKKRRKRGVVSLQIRKARLRRTAKSKHKVAALRALKTRSSPSPVTVIKEENVQLLDEHVLGDDKAPFVCEICSKSFSKRDNLKKHEIIHRGEKPFLCEECGKSFARKQDLNVHRRYHSGVRPYACSLCEKTFHSYSGLKSHENRHNGIKPFLCNACGKTFVQKSQLTNHERVHTQEKPYACTMCEKTFTTLTNLKTHQKRHSGINDFACSVCSKSFFTKSGLERHELLHTGHKAFPCELCDLSFFTKSEITRHMRYHKGEKRFTCSRCNKSFIENQHLVIHERIHTGERPYLCQLCKKSFYTKSKLNRHMRTHENRT